MSNPIEALINDDAVDFRDQINDMLMAKIGDRLELERANVASGLFGEKEPEDEEEGAEDDDQE